MGSGPCGLVQLAGLPYMPMLHTAWCCLFTFPFCRGAWLEQMFRPITLCWWLDHWYPDTVHANMVCRMRHTCATAQGVVLCCRGQADSVWVAGHIE
jgi:hypothetical protein